MSTEPINIIPDETPEAAVVTDIKTRAPVEAKAPQATLNGILAQASDTYLSTLDPDNLPPATQIESDLLSMTNFLLGGENANRQRNNQLGLLRNLTRSQIGDILIHAHGVVRLAPSKEANANTDPENDMLAVYCSDPDDEAYGTYLTSLDAVASLARRYHRDLDDSNMKSLTSYIRQQAPRIHIPLTPDLVPMNNGIFNYKTKELLPFSKEYVFLSKSAIDFDPSATSPVITMPDGQPWDVETWLHELTDDEEITNALWQIAGAVLRPYVRWSKAAFPYSVVGNNGKGSFVQMLRHLLGLGRAASIPLAVMGDNFMLEPLTRATAILVDENNVGAHLEETANLKALITNDVIFMNRKNKQPISYQFWGFMVQCLNEFPQIRDKTQSLYRRQLFIPFNKSYTGVERSYIKDDYLTRTDVLQYVAKKVLLDLPEYYRIDEPTASKALQAEYQEANDPVRAFWEEFREEFTNSYLPASFLVDLFAARYPGYRISEVQLKRQIEVLAKETGDWHRPNEDDPKRQVTVGGRMGKIEPLVQRYRLTGWAPEDNNGKPIWSRPLSAGIKYRDKYKWCLVPTQNSPRINAMIEELRDLRTRISDAEAGWVKFFSDQGLSDADADAHARDVSRGLSCGKTCSTDHLNQAGRLRPQELESTKLLHQLEAETRTQAVRNGIDLRHV